MWRLKDNSRFEISQTDSCPLSDLVASDEVIEGRPVSQFPCELALLVRSCGRS